MNPILMLKPSGKQSNETRNMKHINFVPVNAQRIASLNIIKVVLKNGKQSLLLSFESLSSHKISENFRKNLLWNFSIFQYLTQKKSDYIKIQAVSFTHF